MRGIIRTESTEVLFLAVVTGNGDGGGGGNVESCRIEDFEDDLEDPPWAGLSKADDDDLSWVN